VAETLIVAPIPYEPSAVDDANVTTVGATASITIALAPAILLVPVGTVVDDIALPAVSSTVPMVNEETVKSADDWPAATVYVPESELPADAAVSITVAPVSSVAIMVLPDRIASLVVAEIAMLDPAINVPFDAVVENAVTVGRFESIEIFNPPLWFPFPATSTTALAGTLKFAAVTVESESAVNVAVYTEVETVTKSVRVPLDAEAGHRSISESANPVTASLNVKVTVND
jgi:hypothetical protein